ncbi:g-type lysozyme inhibitor [Aeromonas enteropelogenes]|uniref:pre-peptidase C-terminal domain-containing protein n=1 Tax=Aeromonas enteropelogenes TaxID=29489 RepID=UPI001CE23626|nr:pre-peptidase C-terminal domain-containing protein [Aeromonas enteropelogenes]UCA11565.1 g-type lysozyme inhibitor [Aeromonas enteropelogenes]
MKRAIQAALLAVTMAATGAQAADKTTTVPVQFAKGAHSAQVKGNFSGYDTLHYTLVAKAGQTMTVKIGGSSNANFNVFAPGAIPGQAEALGRNDGNGQWQSTLPTSGKYLIQVYQMRASARRGEQVPHTLSVSIQ